MIAVVFADEGEAKTFYKKVTTKKTDSGTLVFSCAVTKQLILLLLSQTKSLFI